MGVLVVAAGLEVSRGDVEALGTGNGREVVTPGFMGEKDVVFRMSGLVRWKVALDGLEVEVRRREEDCAAARAWEKAVRSMVVVVSRNWLCCRCC